MEGILVAKSTLQTIQTQVLTAFSESGEHFNVDINDPDYGSAFVNYWLFSDLRNLQRIGYGDLSSDIVFYNRYYWLKKFIRLHMAKHGFDAGMEQMESKLLESPGCEPDWSIVENIDKLARLA